MSSRRAERLVNLVICLLATRQYLPASRIRIAVPGYDGTPREPGADEAFKRMFERDKTELRELGVPLETGRNSIFDTEDGYRIARRDYELPAIELEPDEAAALGLAARLWQSAGLAEAAGGALLKLRAAGVDVDPDAVLGVEPRVTATEPAFDRCFAAVRARRPISFDYRTASRGAPERRTVEPWGVVSWRGRWYLVGFDRRRTAPRCFRLSRVTGEVAWAGHAESIVVPEDVDLLGFVVDEGPARTSTARLRIAPGAAAGLRRSARLVGATPDALEDVVEIDYSDPDRLAGRVAGYGPAVFVLGPPEVRDAVVRRLRAAAGEPVGAAPGAP